MKINQLKAGAILSYISLGIGYIVSLAYTPVMLRLLGQSEFGLYNLAASTVSFLGLFSFGFGSAYYRFYSIYKVNNEDDNIAKLNGMFIIIFSIIAVITAIAGALLVINIDTILGGKLSLEELSKSAVLVSIMIFNLSLTFLTTIFNTYIIANERFIFRNIVLILKTVINPFVMLPILLMGYGSVGMVVITTLLNIIVECINIVFCFNKLKMKFLFRNYDKKLYKEITVFSSYIFLNMIVDQINWNAGKFILGKFHGTATVAVFSVAMQLNNYYKTLSTSISSVFIPKINRMVAEKNDNHELTLLFTKVGRIQFIIMALICTGLIFFGQPFIIMWAGINYAEAYIIVLILTIPLTIPLIQNIGIEIQKAKNMHQFRSLVYTAIAFLNILISIPLAQKYGGVGAAIGTSSAIILGNIFMMNWYYHYRVGIDMKFFWRNILGFIPALFIPIVFGIWILNYIMAWNIIIFFVLGLIYVIVYSISMWFFGMNHYERKLIREPMARLLKKLKLVS